MSGHEAIESNLNAYLACFGRVRGGQFHDGEAFKWTFTGTPMLNRIFAARIRGDVDAQVRSALQFFQTQSIPVTWMLGPDTHPPRLAYSLEDVGFTHTSTWSGMALHRDAVPRPRALQPSLTCQPVEDEAALTAWCGVARPSFGLPASLHDEFFRLFSHLLLGQQAPFHGFLARLDEAPAGACAIYIREGVCGIFWVATSEQSRRKGLASAITRYALHSGVAQAASLVVLHATPMGRAVYGKMGFEEHCRFELYTWQPGG